MKLQTLQVIQIFIECRNIVGGASVHIPKHSLLRLKITVGCRLCTLTTTKHELGLARSSTQLWRLGPFPMPEGRSLVQKMVEVPRVRVT